MDEARNRPMATAPIVWATAGLAHLLLHGFDLGLSALVGTGLGAGLVLAYLNGKVAAEPSAASGDDGWVRGLTVLIGLFCAMHGGLAMLAAVALLAHWVNGQKAAPRQGGYATLEERAMSIMVALREAPPPAPTAPVKPAPAPKPAASIRDTRPIASELEVRPFEVASAVALSTPSLSYEPVTSASSTPPLTLEPSALTLESRLPSSLGAPLEGLGTSSGVSGFEEALAMLQEKPRA